MRVLLGFLLALNSVHTSHALECPAGATSKVLDGVSVHVEVCRLVDGRLHGPSMAYHPNGLLAREDHWSNGVKVGTWSEFFDNGQIRRKTNYQDGKKEGPYGEWSQDGRQVVWGYFRDDKEHGIWPMNVGGDRNAEMVFVVFDNGQEITETLFDQLPPTCARWNRLSTLGRAGTLSIMAYLALDELSGAPKALAADRVGAAICFSRSALESARANNDCTRPDAFDDSLQTAVVTLAANCLTGGTPTEQH